MRHRRTGRQLSRTASHRKAMLRNMVTSLFEHERITTTVPKAKEARRVAERMITFAKRGDLHARRHVARYIRDEKVVKKLFETIAPWYAERPGGYTRILKLGFRKGDGGETGILELVKSGDVKEADLKEREEKAAKKAERRAERAKERAEALAEQQGVPLPEEEEPKKDDEEEKK